MISIDKAKEKLEAHVKDAYQKLHAKMVAEVLRAYAEKLGEEEDLWYVTGLLHDLDYYEFPDEHPKKSLEWFKEWEYSDELVHAVEAHAVLEPRVAPKTNLAKCLIAVDELAGFLYAYSLMRPTGFEGMKAKSVKKKFKDKSFAAKVDRDEIMYGVEKFGVDFGEHIDFMVEVFQNMDEFKAGY